LIFVHFRVFRGYFQFVALGAPNLFMSEFLRQFAVLVRVVFVALVVFAAGARADDKVTYDNHLAPILRQRCSSCHSSTTKKADLDVTNYLSLMQGGASGTAIEAGDPDSSYLYSLVNHDAEPYMPMNADKLPDAEIALLRRWIEGGALENKGSKATKPKAKMNVAVEVAPGQRPNVVPLPPRMVLEPFYSMAHAPMARSLATSPWAPLVAVTSQRQVLLYNTATLELVGVYPFPDGQPNVVRFSRDGRLLIAGGGRPAASGKVVVWDIVTGERVTEVGKELDVVLAADISADHKHIALGGPQRVVRVYSIETGELQYEITKHTDWVTAVEFSPDGVLLATADRSSGLYMWEAQTGRDFLTLAGHTAAVTSLSWRGDSNVLASGSEDGTVRLWEPENGTQVKNWNAKTAVLALEFARDGRLITCGRDQVTRLWDQDGKQLAESAPIGDVAVSATFCDESNRAIAASWAGVVQVYNGEPAALEKGSLAPVAGTTPGVVDPGSSGIATNPPKLEERLAAAQKQLDEKVAAAAPLVEAASKAAAELSAAQSAVSVAQQEVDVLRGKVDQLSAQTSELEKQRASQDAERTKIASELANLEAARPAVAEALRYLTEAIGRLPQDSELAGVHRQLTERLASAESRVKEGQVRHAELTAAIQLADTKAREANASLEAPRQELTAAVERLTKLQQTQETAAKSAEAARQATHAMEAERVRIEQSVARWGDEIAFRDRMVRIEANLDAANKLVAERQAEVEKANEQLAGAQSAADSAIANLNEAAKSIEQLQAERRKARGIE
jgi:hypothetical protein